MSSSNEPSFAAFVGIDWGDRAHAYMLEEAGSRQREQGVLAHTPEQVGAWVVALQQRFGGRPIAVCLEQSRGALLAMLSGYDCLVIYPVASTVSARLRAAFFPSGAKDDRPDATLLLDVLLQHRDRLRRLDPDSEPIRQLQFLVEERRKLVHEKTRQKNRLTAKLKLYFPQLLEWFDDIDSELVDRFLRRWPTLQAVQAVRPATLQAFWKKHHSCSQARNQQRLAAIAPAQPATRDGAVLAAATVAVPLLLDLLRVLRQSIAQLDKQIAELAAAQPDFALFEGLPGAGAALAPRLLAAFGSRRERFESAAQLQAYSGIAPVLERSGKRQRTRYRWACPKFLRQSFHEFAAFSRQRSVWAGRYYEQQRGRGKSHHQAVRALAFKWIRILFTCWQSRTPYDEARYLAALARSGSPLVTSLPAVHSS
jgi:transposase